ncbi:MAG: hypothetical protein ACI93T_004724, partial [Porticoccaceae bacterium]
GLGGFTAPGGIGLKERLLMMENGSSNDDAFTSSRLVEA